MTTEQIIALSQAGFSAAQIDQLRSVVDPVPAAAPAPAEPAPAPEPVPTADPIAEMCANFEARFSEFMTGAKAQLENAAFINAEKQTPEKSTQDILNDAFASLYR